ncbi:unnamed protein product [Blumeria hordei]|uniref:Uncharacterized protein n=1 Tax=Blumeria hordei TaxID=2867405 RepID=A0A383URH3_BLUHO|nr:unnamed protein product [Blumeria hordei]
MGNAYEGDNKLRDQLLRACRRSTKLATAIDMPVGYPEELMANLQSTIINHTLASQLVVERSSILSSEQYYLGGVTTTPALELLNHHTSTRINKFIHSLIPSKSSSTMAAHSQPSSSASTDLGDCWNFEPVAYSRATQLSVIIGKAA